MARRPAKGIRAKGTLRQRKKNGVLKAGECRCRENSKRGLKNHFMNEYAVVSLKATLKD